MPKSTPKYETPQNGFPRTPKGPGGVSIDVARLDQGWPEVEPLIRPAVTVALEETPTPNCGELSVVLSDDNHVRTLNRTYRNKDKPTNVLSFPMPAGTGLMGDIVFARETLQREARDQGKSFEDHFSHLLIHGVLHLQGFDHQTDLDARDMESREVQALARLLIDNPYTSNKG